MAGRPAPQFVGSLQQPSMRHPLLVGHIVKFAFDAEFFQYLKTVVTIPRNLEFQPRSMICSRDFRNLSDHRYMVTLSDSDRLQDFLYYMSDSENHAPWTCYRERMPSLSFHSILFAAARTDPSGGYLHAFEECHLLLSLWSDHHGIAMFRNGAHDEDFYGVDITFGEGLFDTQYYPRRVPIDGTFCYGFECSRWFSGDDLPRAPMIPPWSSKQSANPGSPRQHAVSVLRATITEDKKARRRSTIHLLQDTYKVYPETNAFVEALEFLRE